TIEDDVVSPFDLFASLAQYVTVRNALWSLLKDLPTTTAIVVGTPLYNAVQVFELLVKRITDAWQVHWSSPTRADWSRMSLAARRPPAPAGGDGAASAGASTGTASKSP